MDDLSSLQIMMDSPKVKNWDGYTLCPTVPSIQLIPWVSSGMTVWRQVQYRVIVQW
jgi:hypothetical protein